MQKRDVEGAGGGLQDRTRPACLSTRCLLFGFAAVLWPFWLWKQCGMAGQQQNLSVEPLEFCIPQVDGHGDDAHKGGEPQSTGETWSKLCWPVRWRSSNPHLNLIETVAPHREVLLLFRPWDFLFWPLPLSGELIRQLRWIFDVRRQLIHRPGSELAARELGLETDGSGLWFPEQWSALTSMPRSRPYQIAREDHRGRVFGASVAEAMSGALRVSEASFESGKPERNAFFCLECFMQACIPVQLCSIRPQNPHLHATKARHVEAWGCPVLAP